MKNKVRIVLHRIIEIRTIFTCEDADTSAKHGCGLVQKLADALARRALTCCGFLPGEGWWRYLIPSLAKSLIEFFITPLLGIDFLSPLPADESVNHVFRDNVIKALWQLAIIATVPPWPKVSEREHEDATRGLSLRLVAGEVEI